MSPPAIEVPPITKSSAVSVKYEKPVSSVNKLPLGKPVNPLPSPTKAVAVTVPETSNAVLGLVTPIPTLPDSSILISSVKTPLVIFKKIISASSLAPVTSCQTMSIAPAFSKDPSVAFSKSQSNLPPKPSAAPVEPVVFSLVKLTISKTSSLVSPSLRSNLTVGVFSPIPTSPESFTSIL